MNSPHHLNNRVGVERQWMSAWLGLAVTLICIIAFAGYSVADERVGQYSYDNWENPEFCGTSCHIDLHRQWEKAMMSESYTHHWDEIEYFKLAVPHAEMDEEVAEVKAGCNGCHSPMAYLTDDIPPARPEEGTRANEGVHCDFCHTVTGFDGTTPYNFNWISEPGDVKYGPRDLEAGSSPGHETAVSEFLASTELCGTCHNEKSPYDIWVKSTQLEWKEGPYAEENVRCHDCHMTYGEVPAASMGNTYDDTRLHFFPGAHDKSKLQGVVELQIYPDIEEVVPGEPVVLTVSLFNQKAGHKFPTGSVEDRIVWMHVEARDTDGTVYHLPVDEKGFEGEQYTIGADVLAYQDMGQPLGIENFKGVQRDGIPVGDRIFRMPYFDPEGRMTIMQWNTASLGVDYRIGPRETKIETCTFTVPVDATAGPMTITATLNYQKLVRPVAEYLDVPAEEAEIVVINEDITTVEVLP